MLIVFSLLSSFFFFMHIVKDHLATADDGEKITIKIMHIAMLIFGCICAYKLISD